MPALGGGVLPLLVAVALVPLLSALAFGSFPTGTSLAAGVVAATLAWRAVRAQTSAEASRSGLRRIQRLADQVVTGDAPADVILSAEAELTALMDLDGCRFEAPPYESELLQRLERGAPESDSPGLRVAKDPFELQVLSRNQPVGRFVLIPKSGTGISLEQRVVAVALADQVGSALGQARSMSLNERNLSA